MSQVHNTVAARSSCEARRMAESAALLADGVFP